MDRTEALCDEIEKLLASPLPDSDEVLCAELVRVHRLQARLLAHEMRLVSVVTTRRAYATDGSKTVGAWLARQVNGSKAVTRRQARLARRLTTMPATADALAAGEIGEEHASLLAKAAHAPRAVVADAFAEAEETLVGCAKDLPFEDFAVAVAHWENTVDEDGAEDDDDLSFERRRVHLSQVAGGGFVLDGQFDKIGGTELDTALARITDELFKADWAEAREANDGVEPTAGQLPRTPAQRRADALVEMARRAMAMPKGARKPRPLVTVVVGVETLKGRVCELFNTTPVAPGQVARMLDEAEVERVVFDGPRRVIDVGKRRRFFTGGLRRAIEVRDRHCQHPGCRRPAEWCQADHVQPHGWGGETSQENGRLLCEFHNRWRVKGGRPKPQPERKPPGEAAA